MTQPTPGLAEFLLARIAEDEADARDTDPLMPGAVFDHDVSGWWRTDRVLAECEAKRRIVEWHTGRDGCCEERLGPLVVDPDPTVSVSANEWGDLVARRSIGHQQRIGCITLLLLAAPYADHPDFRQEWAV